MSVWPALWPAPHKPLCTCSKSTFGTPGTWRCLAVRAYMQHQLSSCCMLRRLCTPRFLETTCPKMAVIAIWCRGYRYFHTLRHGLTAWQQFVQHRQHKHAVHAAAAAVRSKWLLRTCTKAWLSEYVPWSQRARAQAGKAEKLWSRTLLCKAVHGWQQVRNLCCKS